MSIAYATVSCTFLLPTESVTLRSTIVTIAFSVYLIAFTLCAGAAVAVSMEIFTQVVKIYS